jgi:hypothetical protein
MRATAREIRYQAKNSFAQRRKGAKKKTPGASSAQQLGGLSLRHQRLCARVFDESFLFTSSHFPAHLSLPFCHSA